MAEPGMGEEKKGPGRPRKDGKPQVPGAAGQIAPLQPTNGADMVGAWELDQAVWEEGRVKVSRQEYPSGVLSLVAEYTVNTYSMADVAGTHGPGTYIVTLSADPSRRWKLHNARILISPQYAVENGYHTATQMQSGSPRFQEVNSVAVAARRMQEGTPMQAGELASIIETVADRIAARIPQATPAQAPPPLNLDGMMSLMHFMGQVQDQAEKRVQTLMALASGHQNPVEPTEAGGWADLIKSIMPVVQTFASAMIRPQNTNPVPALAGPSPSVEAQPMNIPLTSDELAPLAGAVRMLTPFASLVVDLVEKQPDPAIAAQEMARFVPEAVEPALIRLAELTAERGPAVLGIISPALATSKGAAVVAALAEVLNPKEGS